MLMRVRLVAWNIRSGGGVRASGIARQLERWRPDLVLLSEFRDTPPSRALSQRLRDLGLVHQRSTTSAHEPRRNALLLASRWPLRRITRGDRPKPSERWILARVDAPVRFDLAGMHVPNAATGEKYLFHDSVLSIAQASLGRPTVLLGDTNSGLPGLDEETPVFTALEESWMRGLENSGWRDAFRHLHGNRRSFTWYSPNGRNGFRLDQAFLNPRALDWLCSVRHVWGRCGPRGARRDALSDHAALVVDLEPRP